MRLTPLLVMHICSGVVGFFAGAAAVSFRKGSRRHGSAGTVFVASMLSLALTGIYLAVLKSRPADVLGGALTLYLVATAWITARRRDAKTGIFDWAALAVLLALETAIITYAIEALTSPTGLAHGYSIGPYGFLGSVTLAAGIGDIRLLVRGGIYGAQRISRHLWRMCFAFFIAAASIFLARQQVFPAVLRRSGALLVLSFLPLALMVFWLIRIRVSRNCQAASPSSEPGSYSVSAYVRYCRTACRGRIIPSLIDAASNLSPRCPVTTRVVSDQQGIIRQQYSSVATSTAATAFRGLRSQLHLYPLESSQTGA
ncbi:MAG: hypothetical protein ACRD40_11705 [Candidatus Acidiferrales bacterium]